MNRRRSTLRGSGDDVAARLYAVAPGAPTTQTFGPTRPTGGAVELSETDLVKRGPYLVDADTDRLYTYYAGAVFASREAKPTFGDRAPLLFFVTDDDRLAFLEPAGSRTWSEIVARKAWRQRVSAA